jgi:hypothetical protein
MFGAGDGCSRASPTCCARCRCCRWPAGARFAPVYVGDVVEAIPRTLDDRATIGEVYELYGPEVFTPTTSCA